VDRSRVGIVIPTLNEARTIERIVAAARLFGVPIVVDDGSGDATGELARAAGASVVTHAVNRGYDGALNSGFEHAARVGCEYAITMDADGQHDPAILGQFISALDAGADVVIGVRDRRQRIAEHVFAWVAYVKWGVRDPLCGMKGYRMSVYRELGHFDRCNSIGTELAIYAAKSGRRIAQLPVKTRDRDDEPRFGRRFSANRRILRALLLSLSATPAR
jgi:glycosyltransferase involved in cell wall biosynthesis